MKNLLVTKFRGKLKDTSDSKWATEIDDMILKEVDLYVENEEMNENSLVRLEKKIFGS
jgi:hypothetical protein